MISNPLKHFELKREVTG